jgi:hypothetical protein
MVAVKLDPTMPHFPRVAPALLSANAPRELTEPFLGEVRIWRDEALAWLGTPERSLTVSDRLARVVALSLGAVTSPSQGEAPYDLPVFPKWLMRGREGMVGLPAEGARALHVLAWRARIAISSRTLGMSLGRGRTGRRNVPRWRRCLHP